MGKQSRKKKIEEKPSYWGSFGGSMVLFNAIVGTLLACFPDWALEVFLLFVCVTSVSFLCGYYWYKQDISSTEYKNRTSHLFFTVFGIFLVTPLIRSMEGELAFFLSLFFAILVWVVTFLFRKVTTTILTSQQNAYLCVFIVIAIFIAFTGVDRRHSQGWSGFFFSEAGEMIYFYAVLYSIGLITLFLANAILRGIYIEEEKRNKKEMKKKKRKRESSV